MKNQSRRVIGKYVGNHDGPLLICIGGIHGNEPAGVQALELIFKMLEVEPITNPDFRFNGTMLGIRGNLQALEQDVRFLEKDMNRAMGPKEVDRIFNTDPSELVGEDIEIREVISIIRDTIEEVDPEKVIILDLHTTTATGGIFVLTADDNFSIQVGIEMHAPVIIGFESMLQGTTMGYFKPERFNGLDITTVVFESGQHRDPLSVNRAIAATINCMRTIGSVSAEDVENRHDYLLIEYSEGFPKVARLVERYDVDDVSRFEMLPGLQNFDKVKEGQLLAYDKGREVLAPKDSLIIMPKYQKQGNDGFFLVERQENGQLATIP